MPRCAAFRETLNKSLAHRILALGAGANVRPVVRASSKMLAIATAMSVLFSLRCIPNQGALHREDLFSVSLVVPRLIVARTIDLRKIDVRLRMR
jgi:hypothetical protein